MYIERGIKSHFEKVKNLYNIIAVVGARQSGKTTFLKEQAKSLNASYVFFDDPDSRTLFEADIKKFEKQYIEGYEVCVLDEVQYCKGAGSKLKYLADKGRKIWLTSSSEIILGEEVLSYLVGRVSVIKLYPFSLAEFLAAKNQKAATDEILHRIIWEHTTYGGYPKVAFVEDPETKKILLSDLYETMLLKDVAKTFSITDIGSLEQLAKYLSNSIGNMASYADISSDLKLSFHTIKKYLSAMEKSYIIKLVQPFYNNKLKEISKQPKIYFIDCGLRNIISKLFLSEPEGKLFENYVLTELTKVGFSPKFWRTKSKAEIDFIVEKGNAIIPIEVKLNSNLKIEKSMHSFINAYKPEKALVVAYKGEKGKTKINGCEIIFTDIARMKEELSK